ncbi:MAG TPA: potassium channel family protein [Spirochaetota bacterium]|nr:potassium channel family protein [Spirochaetota bacterium]HPC41919.1 potassium channel family protein [Spirochaetota bacterium]HQF09629.1 potassium channel family protein [Spirochaetota bacterium]HQH98301.1 potassium channel family protein [Spirochaetota bacterium]HQJ71729.1 potassium channel family protein [Spirochaetota bacterium]
MPKGRYQPVVKYRGNRFSQWRFYYHAMLTMSPLLFILCIGIVFVSATLLFAVLYRATGTVSLPARAGFLEYVYFSIVTFATVGYGDIIPVGAGRLIAVVEVFCGILFTGTVTGLIFARFARTPSPFVWSTPVVLYSHEGERRVQVRVTNIVGNDVIDVETRLFLQTMTRTRGGNLVRQLVPVSLEQSTLPIFAFTWVLSHRVDDRSPLKAWADGTAPDTDRLVAFIHGHDSTIGRSAYSYTRWRPSSVVEGEFENIMQSYRETPELRTVVEMDLRGIDRVSTPEK